MVLQAVLAFHIKMYQECPIICSLTPWEQPPSIRPDVGSCLWAGPLGQSTPLCLKTGLGFSLAPLPRTCQSHLQASLCCLTHWHSCHGNATPSRPLAVKNRSSQKNMKDKSFWSSVYTHGGCALDQNVFVLWIMHPYILFIYFLWPLTPPKIKIHNQIIPRKMCWS